MNTATFYNSTLNTLASVGSVTIAVLIAVATVAALA
jgi:hypothetical protein